MEFGVLRVTIVINKAKKKEIKNPNCYMHNVVAFAYRQLGFFFLERERGMEQTIIYKRNLFFGCFSNKSD